MTIRARLKRQSAERDRWVYLVSGLGRVRRGSVISIQVRHPSVGRKPLAVGWFKADRSDPIIHWGHP